MTTKQKLELLNFYDSRSKTFNEMCDFVESIEKQAAIDALKKAERIEEKQNEIYLPLPKPTKSDYDWHVSVGGRCGALTAYLTHFIDKMTPDQRELVAMEFDKNLFDSDKVIAERFRKSNDTEPINN